MQERRPTMNTSRASPFRTGDDHLYEPRNPPRTLAGATILQILPALREGPAARTALEVSSLLLQAGARSLIAGRDGPLVSELKANGGEWVPLASDSASPLTRRRNVSVIENLLTAERIDIVHAHCAG